MPATTYSARQVFHPAIHSNYLRDRRRGAYAHIVSFNAVEYQQALEPQQRDYVAVAKNALSFAWHTAVNLWTKAGQW